MLTKSVLAGRGFNSRCLWSRSLPVAPAAAAASLSRSASSQPRRHSSLADLLPSASASASPLVLESTSTNPYHNLAIEDHLLHNSAHSSHILFLYTNRACVVLGRNQNPWQECNLRSIRDGLLPPAEGQHHDTRMSGVDLVRRRSGGGTVFHDEGNLNYAVIVPNDTTFKRAKHAQMVADALTGMTDYDFKAQIRVSERNDIVMLRDGQPDWLKISGSAFKLIRGRALHHGTLLYSSPSLKHISGLLNSPGRGLIHARGVESVRSKVGNLMWTADVQQRRSLRDSISRAIIRQFRAMYGQGSEQLIQVGDQDINTPSIRHGADEMALHEWSFSQTPKFDFQSGLVQWHGQQDEIVFHSNRGRLDQLTWRNGKDRVLSVAVKDVMSDSALDLHTINDWSGTLKSLLHDESRCRGGAVAHQAPWQNRALVQLLETVFPAWPTDS